jgi:hypothetical protein
VTVAMADVTRPAPRRLSISRAAKGGIQFCFNDLLDKTSNPFAQAGLDRIEPVVKEVNSPITVRLRSLGLHGSIRHGVVSSGLSAPNNSSLDNSETTPTTIPTNFATAPSNENLPSVRSLN